MNYLIKIKAWDLVIGYHKTYGDACTIALGLSINMADVTFSVYRWHRNAFVEECQYTNGK